MDIDIIDPIVLGKERERENNNNYNRIAIQHWRKRTKLEDWYHQTLSPTMKQQWIKKAILVKKIDK